MRKLAVVHHRHAEWVEAIAEAEPRLDLRGWHPDASPGWGTDPWLGDAEALFAWRVPPGLLARMPRLRWIQNSGAGVDHLLADPSIPAGIPITRADGQFGLWMARYVAGHLLAGCQRLEECARAQTERRWLSPMYPEDLTGRTALVVGFGRIGRTIGRALRALGLDVHGFVREGRDDPEFPLHGHAALASFLPSARLLVLSAPLTPGTRGLVDARLLASGHAGLLLVNVARGELVVEADLLAALDAGTVGRAVLDVFSSEPLPPASPLWAHPRVTVTPHHSGPSRPRSMVPDILPNLRRYAEGRAVEGAVDRSRGY
jgi:glyoxylate/hydroxypyruvate reductase